jgi:hypothetical protein
MSDLKPVDLWLAITAMPRPSVIVDFPRNGPDGNPVGELRIQVLTQEEQILCSAEAERYTKKAIKELPKENEAQLGYQNVYNNSAAVEVLYHCCRKKDAPLEPFFPSRDAIRKFLSPDEVGVLLMHYYTAQTDLGPIVAHLSEVEMDAWIARLGEGGTRFPLDFLSLDALKDLAFSLACRMHSFATATSSPGLPPESDSSSPSPTPDPPT